MEQVGTDFAASGSVLSRDELENQRRKRGECVTCGRKCFQKKLFKLIPITETDRVLEGRCLKCKPLDNKDQTRPVVSKPTSREDMARFALSQSNLNLSGPGMVTRSDRTQPRRTASASDGLRNSLNRNINVQSTSTRVLLADETSSREFKRSVLPHNSTDSHATAPPNLGNNGSLNFSQHSPHSARHSHTSRDDFIGSQHTPSCNERYASGGAGGAANAQGYQDYDAAYISNPLNRRPSGESLSSHRSNTEERELRRQEDAYSYHGPPHVSVPGGGGQYLADYQQQQMFQELNNSQRSLYSHGSAPSAHSSSTHTHHSVNEAPVVNPYPRTGMLNRGGQVSFNKMSLNISKTESSRSVRSHVSSRSGRNSGHTPPSNSSKLQSTRSLESVNSFEDESDQRAILQRRMDLRNSGDSLSLSQHVVNSRPQTYHQFSNRQLAMGTGQDGSQNSSSALSSSLLSVTVASRDTSGLDQLHVAGSDYVEIIHIMREFHESALVQVTAMQHLSSLHISESDSSRLALAGGVDAIVEGMRQHPMDIDLQIEGCRAMWNASGTTGNQVAFVEAGALDVVLMSMGQFLSDAVMQEQAMAALANLGAAERNVEIMMERGAVGAIVEAMNKHADNIHVQMKGCGAVTNMASHMSPFKQVIMDAGGGGAVVIAMVMHPDDHILQEKALRALRNLSANCEHNKIELATMGGIDAVISAMQVHRDAAGVQEAGAWTLSNLAGNIENKVMIGEYGGVDVTIRAMWVHSEEVKVQEWCCRALFSLSLDLKNGDLIREVGGVSAVVNAMQAHVDRSVIQEMGCAVICNLATDDTAKMRIVDEEALDAIVLGMVIHSEDVRVQERGCQVLVQLAILDNCKSMQASNVGELVRAAAERFPEECSSLADLLLRSLENFAAEYNQVHAAP